MRMAKSLIAAALIAVALVGAVVVPAALTRGTFAFDAWPEASRSHAQREDVAVAAPAKHIVAVRFERADARPSGPSAPPADSPPPSHELARATPRSLPAQGAPKPRAHSTPTAPQQAPSATPVEDVAQSD